MANYDLVCFDLGGVLVRIHTDWGGAGESAGVVVRDEVRVCRLPDAPSFLAYQAGQASVEEYLADLAGYLGVTEDEAMAVHRSILREFFPGIPELLAELRGAGVRTGCLSNTNEPHWQELMATERFAPLAGLDVRMASHHVQLEKPDPAIFRLYSLTADVLPERVLFFDDSADNVASAGSVGWHGVVVDPKDDPARQISAHLREVGLLSS